LAALDREPVRPGGEPRLGTLQSGELLAEVVRQALVELVLVQLRGEVSRIDVVRRLAGVLVAETGERPLDTRSLGGKQFLCTLGIDGATLPKHRGISVGRAGLRRPDTTTGDF
jgi:hypothetical protein